MRHYEYKVTWSEEDDMYVGTCYAFPSLSWIAHTPEEAMGGICLLVRDCVKDINEEKEKTIWPAQHSDAI